MKELTELDWVRLAAFIDGEGCISLSAVNSAKRKGCVQTQLGVTIPNTDPRLAVWCKELLGGSIYTKTHKNPKHRTCFIWLARGKVADRVVRGCFPYLLLKKEQAEIALAFRDTIRTNRKKLTEEEQSLRLEYKQQLSDLKHVEWPTDAVM